MLITFSSRILARFHTEPPEILADGNFAFRPDLSKILTARGFVSRREPRQHSHRDIRLPAKNPGKTPAGIPPRFWPPGIPPPAKNPGKIPAGIPDFGRRESRLPPRIPVRIPAGTGNPGGQNLGGIPAGILPGSWQDPAKIPVPFLQGITLSDSATEGKTFPFNNFLILTRLIA